MKNIEIDKYVCIQGNEIEEIYDISDEHFWKTKGRTEHEYKEFVEASQDFFIKFAAGIDCDGYKINGADANYVYVHIGNCIMVRKNGDKYICTSNGRHRCAVAKKYNLKLLVRIED